MKRSIVAASIVFALALTACGGDDDDASDSTTAATDGASAATDAPDTSAATGATEAPDGTDAPDGTAAADGELTPVSLTLQWVTQAQFAGFYAALDQGYYEEEGIDLDLRPGGPDVNPIQLLVSGDTDLAIQQFGSVLTSRDEGVDLISIGQVFERSAYRLLSFEDKGIETADDFKGKTVGLWAGFQPAFSATAGKHDLSLDDDVEIFNQGFDMVALLDEQVDLASAMTYNEYAQALAGADGRALRTFDFNEDGTATLEDTVATSREWAEANPELAEGFLRASIKGWDYCRDDPDACVQLIIDNGSALLENFQTWQMNEVNQLIWPSTNGAMNLTDDMFQQTADILLEYGVIKEAATTDSFDMSYRDAAVEGLSEEDLMGADYVPQDLDPDELFAND
jgi:NitT/TauT family transport system substrate-binding protein